MPDKHYLIKKQFKEEKLLCPIIENFHQKFPYPKLYGDYASIYAPTGEILDQPTQIVRAVETQIP